tara:strand:+ start:482 stop:1189 length:708 start_codon:yes stop_codon:yes gene_type:complete
MAKAPKAKLPGVKPPTIKPPSVPKPPKAPGVPGKPPKGPDVPGKPPKGPDVPNKPKIDTPPKRPDPPKPKKKMSAKQKAAAALAVGAGVGGTLYLLDAEKAASRKVKECVGKCLPLNWDQFVGYEDGVTVSYAELDYRPTEDEEEEEDQPYCREGISEQEANACGDMCQGECESLHKWKIGDNPFKEGGPFDFDNMIPWDDFPFSMFGDMKTLMIWVAVFFALLIFGPILLKIIF